MASFLAPPAYKPEQTGPEADAKYNKSLSASLSVMPASTW